jgi:hypothetical protein
MMAMSPKIFLVAALVVRETLAWGYCNDKNESCAGWARAGQCEVGDHIKEMCPHSCASCPHTCRDSEEMCPAWADNGECKKNIDFMYRHCGASCGVCKTRCYDKDPACAEWARSGECSTNTGLLTICPSSCGLCTELCLDKHNDCPNWANDGACSTNAAYMLKECPNSCGICNDVTHAQSNHPTTRELHLSETRACADTDRTQCLIWGQHECDANPGSLLRMCPHTCGVCTLACEDKYGDCPNWALGKSSMFGSQTFRKGCDDDPKFMLYNCPHSCGICPRLHVFPSKTDPVAFGSPR